MGIIQLILLGTILKKKMEYLRMLYSAGIGSFLGCLILEFCSKYHTLSFLMIEPVLIITIKAAYGVSVKKAGTYSLYAWILAFVSGGIFTVIRHIRDVKRAVTIPVIANGDIFSGADAAHILRYTGADLAMIGRGSFGDPWLFARGNAAIAGEPEPPLPPLRERIEAALHQIEFAAEIKGERLACLEARSQFCWYLRGVPHANVYKQEVVHVETLDDLRRITRAVQRDLRD